MSLSDWDLDLTHGQVGEALVNDLLTGGFTVEVKRDRRWAETGNLYIETYCWYNLEQAWKESGILVTKADYWAFVLNETVLMIPTRKVICIFIKTIHRAEITFMAFLTIRLLIFRLINKHHL